MAMLRYVADHPPALRCTHPDESDATTNERWRNFVRVKNAKQKKPLSFSELSDMWGNMTEAEKDTYLTVRAKATLWELDEVVVPSEATPAGIGNAVSPVVEEAISDLTQCLVLRTFRSLFPRQPSPEHLHLLSRH